MIIYCNVVLLLGNTRTRTRTRSHVNVTTEQRDGSNRCRFTFMHLVDAFIQNNLQCIQGIDSLSVCVTWELNPQPFAPLTQCSTTEPQEHKKILFYQHTRH